MRNYFIFDGVDSRDFGVYISGDATFNAPERVREEVEIPGKNGKLIYDCGRYRDIEHSYEAFIYRYFSDNIARLRTFMLSRDSYCRLEDTYHPDEFYLAYFVGGVDVDATRRRDAGKFSLRFERKPQRFLKAGETVKAFTVDGVLVNPSLMTARPLVRVYGVGTFAVGGTEVTVTQNPGYIDLDCDIEDAYMGAVNCNDFVQLTDFPVLSAGENAITLGAGIGRLEITPRWWIL